MSKKILEVIAFFIIGMVGGIFADQIFWPYIIERPLFYEYRLEKSPVYVTERKEITIQENTALTQAIEKVEKTVVGIKTTTKTGEILKGSGLIVTSDGLLVTLAELVPKGSQFSFFTDGKQFSYQILKRDLENNLALVKIEGTNLPTLSFADLEKLKLGERIFLVGALPLGGWTANEGIVKKIDTNLITTNISEEIDLRGSPLFNVSGEVVGINTLDSKGEITAIPVDMVKKFIGM